MSGAVFEPSLTLEDSRVTSLLRDVDVCYPSARYCIHLSCTEQALGINVTRMTQKVSD